MIILILIWMSIQDVKKLEVNIASQVALLIACLIQYATLNYFLFLFVLFWFMNKFFVNKMGGADYKVYLMLSLVYGHAILYIIFISTIIAIPFSIACKKIPFIPFITLGVICLNLAT